MIGQLLAPREEEIARFVAAGLLDKEIARTASISVGNVKIHLHRSCQKLGIANRAALAVMARSGASPRSKRTIRFPTTAILAKPIRHNSRKTSFERTFRRTPNDSGCGLEELALEGEG